MNPFKKSTLVKNLLQMPFAAAVVLSIALLSGCGSSQGLVEIPDDPIPKPETIPEYNLEPATVHNSDNAKIVE